MTRPLCHAHGGTWLASCTECREARAALATVPNGTVHAARLRADQRRRQLAAARAAGVLVTRSA